MSEAEVRQAIDELDLTSVREFVAEEGYSGDEVEAMEREYRRFLFLNYKYRDGVVPSRAVDEYWHEHVLDTEKYAEDCQKIFGFFLHHVPFSRQRAVASGEWRGQSKEDLITAFEKTKSRYQEVFEEPFPSGPGAESARCCTSLHDAPPIALGPR